MATERTENRITLPQHIRDRAKQRASELGYTALVDYVTELVMVDTSPLIARQGASVPQSPPQQQEQSSIAVNAGGGWGDEI
ncbi:hypothetical protein [Leptothoe kymatousa]|uniref:Uncharacterized protein n=1 Tax=Leptothoe kymatousa TAU-MAC 1615 TaxID=2364775 RepID=A0ABS5Y400_9CYAN|nr:hypothetical protein [Leptothoe kymatousa]MBT9312559.1 hypothetical protein [Leptothoe kymatousa TAU-MAC 1615]